MLHRSLTTHDGTTIAYTVIGGPDHREAREANGPMDAPCDRADVVILHGLAGSSREFVETARALSPRRVILIDQRGHGASTTDPVDVSPSAFMSDVVAVIRAESAGPVDLVGQSMGARAAVLTAAEHPELVQRMVLLECDEGGMSTDDARDLGDYFASWPVPFASSEDALAFLGDGPLQRAWIADFDERPGGLFPRFSSDTMSAVAQTLTDSHLDAWARVTTPTLVVYTDGGMFSEDRMSRFMAHGNSVQRLDLVAASHDAHLDAFDQWSAVLREFLSTDSASVTR